jgi:chorismate mutase
MAKTTAKKEFDEKESRDIMTEVKTGRRVFDTPLGLMQVRFPKVEENRLADWEYTKVLNQALKDGIPTSKQMGEMILEFGLWTEKDEKKITDLRDEINKQVAVLDKMTEGSKNFDAITEKIEELRQTLFGVQQERQKLYQNTAESKADESKMSFLIYKCSENAETDKPVWSSYDEFKNEENQEFVNIMVYQFLTFINGLPADFLSTPSAKTEVSDDEESDE